MNKIKNSFVPMLLVVALLCAFVLPFSLQIQQANANEPENGARYSDTIYYFFDYYPEIRESTMLNEFPNYNIVYDRASVDQQGIDSLCNNGYFDKFDTNCVVVIDIKTFKPEPALLDILFTSLKNQGCKTMFISLYDVAQYADDSFLDYVDVFFYTNLSKLEDFIDYMLNNEYLSMNDTLNNTAFFIDGNLVDVHSHHGESAEVLCQQSIFLSIFLEKLYYKVNADEVVGIITADEFLNYLDILNISIYVHDMDCGQYVNIFNGYADSGDSVDDFLSRVNRQYLNVCAFGFWALHTDFYDFLYNSIESPYTVTNYVIEADLIEYSDDGLPIIVGIGGHEEDALGMLRNLI